MNKFRNNAFKLIESKLNWKYITNEYIDLAMGLLKDNNTKNIK